MLLTIVLWWGATAVIARSIGGPTQHYPRLIVLASVIGLAALALLVTLRDTNTTGSALFALLAALGIWGWIEITFLTGTITGPATLAGEADAGLWRRAVAALTAILWHELLIAATVAIVALTLFGHSNDLALLLMLLLWLMRSSAKLNLFLGVRNLGEGFLPPHLQHLLGFMRHRRMNPLLPLSLVLGAAIGWYYGGRALLAETSYDATASTILATLAVLAVLEHLLMVIPVPAEALWRWSLSNRRTAP